MSKELEKRNFWDNLSHEIIPTFFDNRGLYNRRLFKGFDQEIGKILNGKCDFEETDDKYSIELEVPGIKKEEINLSLREGIITITWNRKKEEKSNKGKSRYERHEGNFSRSFDVEGADPEKIEAELKNGVLKIVLFKTEDIKPKKIQIN